LQVLQDIENFAGSSMACVLGKYILAAESGKKANPQALLWLGIPLHSNSWSIRRSPTE